jgi:hypothetical protein
LKKIKQRVLRLVWIALLIIINITSSNADEWKVNAGIVQNISYDDNVIMRGDDIPINDDDQNRASLIYKVTPSLNLSHKTDVSDISAFASYGVQRYFDIKKFDRNHQNYGIKGQYNTERIRWELDSSYSVTPSRDTAQQESGEFDIDAERKSFSISPSVSYEITEQDSLSFLTQYINAQYSINDSDRKELTDERCTSALFNANKLDTSCNFSNYNVIDFKLLWSRKWSERYRSSLDVFYTNFKSSKIITDEDELKSHTGGANITSTYIFSESLDLFGTVGFRVTKTNDTTNRSFIILADPEDPNSVDKFSTKEGSNEPGWLLNIGANYHDNNWQTEFVVYHGLEPSSQGGLLDQTKVSIDLRYDFTERLYATLLSDYQISKPHEGENERTNVTFHPSISWRLNPEWTLSTSYRYRYQKRFLRSNEEEEADSNLYMLSINYRWQGLNIAR